MARTFKDWEMFFDQLKHQSELNILSLAEENINSKQIELVDKMTKDADFLHFRMDLNLSNTITITDDLERNKVAEEITQMILLYGLINCKNLLNDNSKYFQEFLKLQVKRLIMMVSYREQFEKKYGITI